MKSIHIQTGARRSYEVSFTALDRIGNLISKAIGFEPARYLVVTDETVGDLYLNRLTKTLGQTGAPVDSYAVPPGEQSKNIHELSKIIDWALDLGVDRTTPLLALGGGVVGDLAGFAAASLLRGLPLVHVPTSLTSQVDSSIGGKTGINHRTGKNLIGAFYAPKLVIADTRLLDTLPDGEWRSGMAEVVKHAYIDTAAHYRDLLAGWEEVIKREHNAIDTWIPRSASVKAAIVQEDEKESGSRMWLNLGHTTGHAIELTSDYGSFTHGEAVAFGLAVAVEWSREHGNNVDGQLAYRLLREMSLRERIAELDPETVFNGISMDKKKARGAIRFVMLESVGHPYLETNVTLADFQNAWKSALANI